MANHSKRGRFGLSLHGALLALVATVLVVGLVPAGIVLEQWVGRELESLARQDLAMAPRVHAERNAALGDALMMHAKDLAHDPALVQALARGDDDSAARVADQAARALAYHPILVDGRGAPVDGVNAPSPLVQATRRGEMPVAVVPDARRLYMVSLAPVESGGRWDGAAGLAVPLDDAAAAAVAGLTRSDAVVFALDSAALAASTPDTALARALAGTAAAAPGDTAPRELRVAGRRFLVATARLGGGSVVFARDLALTLAILPRLRWVLAVGGAGALLFALLLGSVLSLLIGRPVRTLAGAAARLSAGDFDAPLQASPIREVARVTDAFAAMRDALAVRIDELRAANRALEERQARLTALQAELIRRERVAVSSRMVAELAHEIRNPIANVRNCLELLSRRVQGDPEGREFAGLAIDELLRMHELAERMLDLNRPRDPGAAGCDAAAVVAEVAALARVGRTAEELVVEVHSDSRAPARIPADALKQVLVNLVENAREAMPEGLTLELTVERGAGGVALTVSDNGPGIPEDIRERVFDPFFSTRSATGGMGLGLSVVEAVLRGYGGSVRVMESDSGGACFRIALPAPAAAREAPRFAPETPAHPREVERSA